MESVISKYAALEGNDKKPVKVFFRFGASFDGVLFTTEWENVYKLLMTITDNTGTPKGFADSYFMAEDVVMVVEPKEDEKSKLYTPIMSGRIRVPG